MATGPRYVITILRAARKQLAALPREEQERLRSAIDGLADDPRPHGVVKLKGADDQYRIRVGEYRVLYAIASSCSCCGSATAETCTGKRRSDRSED